MKPVQKKILIVSKDLVTEQIPLFSAQRQSKKQNFVSVLEPYSTVNRENCGHDPVIANIIIRNEDSDIFNNNKTL